MLDDPRLPERTVDFVEWAARWTLSPPGEMAATALKGLRAPQPRPERRVRRVGDRTPARPTAARTAVLEALGERADARPPTWPRAAGVSSGVVKGLIDEGVLEIIEIEAGRRPSTAPDPDHAPATLNADQAAAADALAAGDARRAASRPSCSTASPARARPRPIWRPRRGRWRADPDAQVLILLPEIALTQALIARITGRFGAAPAEWHSGVAPPRRRQVWEAVVAGPLQHRGRRALGPVPALRQPAA